jgi:nucleoid DNA-binding protein
MNELINMVKSKVGISDDQAKQAVETVINALKQRLPSSLSSQIDSALSGGLGEAAKGMAGKLPL